MVRFIIGRAGQGKTRQAYSEMAAALHRQERAALLLVVPEQYTLEAEKELVKFLGGDGLLDIEVTSFSRLAQRIASEVGGRGRVPLNELGSQLLMRRVIQENRSRLGFFSRAAGQNGFSARASLTIREFKQQGIGSVEMEAAARVMEAAGEMLPAGKLRDLGLLMSGLEKEQSGGRLDHDDFINLFIRQIPGSQWLRQAQIWIDGFEGFSVQNMRIILALAAVCPALNITVTLDRRDSPRDSQLFWLSRHCLQYLEKELAGAGIPFQRLPATPPDSLSAFEKGCQERPAALIHLERELFSYPGRLFSGPLPGLELFSGSNPALEVEHAAARILQMVMEKGWRYRDIALVCGDFQQYAPLIQRYFAEYEIPVFLDYKRPVSAHPLAVLLNSALAALDRNFPYEDMALYMKSGLSGLEPDSAEILENYALAHGIRGRRWQEEFVYGDEGSLEALNKLRRQLMEPLLGLGRRLAAARGNCAGMAVSLLEFIEELAPQPRLESLARELQKQGRLESVYIISQGWNQLMDLLDQVYSVMGSQTASLGDFRAMLASGLEAVEIGLIPTTVDQVQAGDVGRSLARELKALFLLGVNDGILPSSGKSMGLLSDQDFAALNRLGLEFGYDRQRHQAQERLLLYSLLAKPSRSIIISYARSDQSGKALRPSLLVERLQRLYPRLLAGGDLADPEALALGFIKRRRPFLRHISSRLRQAADGEAIDPLWLELARSAGMQPAPAAGEAEQGPGEPGAGLETGLETVRVLELVSRALQPPGETARLLPGQARQLYGLQSSTSISRLEKQAACPFSHFAEYGLQARPRPIFSLENTDLGSILHRGLASLAAELRGRGLKWQDISPGEVEEAMAGIHRSIVNENYPELLQNQARSRLLSRRLQDLSQRTAATVAWQISRGDFEPWREELGFGAGAMLPALPVPLSSGAPAQLRGSIDRVDLHSQPGEESPYARIIDYKTSARRLEYGLLYAGISLQLPAYMLALRHARPGIQPAGLFYLALNDALAPSTGSETGPGERMSRILKMQGLVLADATVIRAMDRDISGWSRVLSARVNARDGQPASYDAHLDPVQFEALLAHTARLLAGLYEASLQGEVRAEPYRYGSRCACDYCPYPALCRFDGGSSGGAFRRVPRLDKAGFFGLVKPGPSLAGPGEE